MKRYAITHISGITGLRTLTFANQDRYMYDSRDEAEAGLEIYAPHLREKVLGQRADTLAVREVDCYDSTGDAKCIYFDEPVPH